MCCKSGGLEMPFVTGVFGDLGYFTLSWRIDGLTI